MINYRNEVVRLLLKICVLLLEAKREEIMIDELNDISEKSFDIKGAAWLLEKKGFANSFEWDNETKQYTKLALKYSLEEYKKVIEKIDNKKLAYIPDEIVEGDYRDLPIRGKIIWGTGAKAIVLVDGVKYYHEYAHPRTDIGKKRFFNYKRNKLAAEKLAKEILEEYGER